MLNVSVRTISLIWLFILPLSAYAEAAQPTPMPGTSVHDFAGVISAEKKAAIQAQARQLKEQYQTEIAVVTIDSLQGEDSFDYSMRMARAWGIGSKDNYIRGLLILVAIKDRKTAFRTSRHIEGELTDGVTGDIGRRMNVYFKQGDFGGGLNMGMGMILERLKETYQPQPVPTAQPEAGSRYGWLWLPFGAFAFGLGYMYLRYRKLKGSESAGGKQATIGGFLSWLFSRGPATVPKKRITADTSDTAHAAAISTAAALGFGASQGGDFGSANSDSSSSSSDSGSSSGNDSAGSYSGGSDFGGGGTDTSW